MTSRESWEQPDVSLAPQDGDLLFSCVNPKTGQERCYTLEDLWFARSEHLGRHPFAEEVYRHRRRVGQTVVHDLIPDFQLPYPNGVGRIWKDSGFGEPLLRFVASPIACGWELTPNLRYAATAVAFVPWHDADALRAMLGMALDVDAWWSLLAIKAPEALVFRNEEIAKSQQEAHLIADATRLTPLDLTLQDLVRNSGVPCEVATVGIRAVYSRFESETLALLLHAPAPMFWRLTEPSYRAKRKERAFLEKWDGLLHQLQAAGARVIVDNERIEAPRNALILTDRTILARPDLLRMLQVYGWGHSYADFDWPDEWSSRLRRLLMEGQSPPIQSQETKRPSWWSRNGRLTPIAAEPLTPTKAVS